MNRSEIKKRILSKFNSLAPKEFSGKWNLIFSEEKIDITTMKEKDYFLEVLKEELSILESSDLKKAYSSVK